MLADLVLVVVLGIASFALTGWKPRWNLKLGPIPWRDPLVVLTALMIAVSLCAVLQSAWTLGARDTWELLQLDGDNPYERARCFRRQEEAARSSAAGMDDAAATCPLGGGRFTRAGGHFACAVHGSEPR